eukprot:GSChrysophyteH1.ASY1.ANO1.1089.1 assembled CDS
MSIQSRIGTHRVCSYNVLSSHLAGEDHFRHCNPEYLDRKYRLKLIMETLEDEMSRGSIIALQEVGQEWGAELHAFFAKNEYYFVCRHYGGKFNDYMGVGLAVPLKDYEIAQVNNKRIADTFWYKPPPKKHWLVGTVLSWFWCVVNFLLKVAEFVNMRKEAYSPIKHAMERWNILTSIKVLHKQSQETFWVSTYHMPCAFQHPDMMTIHASLALQYLQRLTGAAASMAAGVEKVAVPYILLGDFNFKPEDGQYALYRDGSLDTSHAAYPAFPDNLKCGGGAYKVALAPVRSAYKVYNGTEPEYTNNARVTWNAKVQPHFKETLDYIFLSPEWAVNKVRPLDYLPTKEEQDEPFPSKTEPSDHVLLWAELELSQ